jgi:pimeloyl-ACP methyl ester carboxylesterase
MATDMQATKSIETSHLHMAYEETGDPKGTPIVLVHGWPDDVRCWDKIAPELAKLGYRIPRALFAGLHPYDLSFGTNVEERGNCRARTLCRYLWQTWSPGWKFTDSEFEATA